MTEKPRLIRFSAAVTYRFAAALLIVFALGPSAIFGQFTGERLADLYPPDDPNSGYHDKLSTLSGMVNVARATVRQTVGESVTTPDPQSIKMFRIHGGTHIEAYGFYFTNCPGSISINERLICGRPAGPNNGVPNKALGPKTIMHESMHCQLLEAREPLPEAPGGAEGPPSTDQKIVDLKTAFTSYCYDIEHVHIYRRTRALEWWLARIAGLSGAEAEASAELSKNSKEGARRRAAQSLQRLCDCLDDAFMQYGADNAWLRFVERKKNSKRRSVRFGDFVGGASHV